MEKVLTRLRIIPWERGELAIELTFNDGTTLARKSEYDPACRTKDHLRAEAIIGALELKVIELETRLKNRGLIR